MQLFRFDAGVGTPISHFDSQGLTITRIAQTKSDLQVLCMHLAAGGVVGRHPATVPQLFLVVYGEGWVTGDDNQRLPIRAGQAAFWSARENHQTQTENGLMAIVLEGPDLNPAEWLTRL